MNDQRWICERCMRQYDLENGEGWVTLVNKEPSPPDGKLTPLHPHEKVCYECADELYAIVEKCDKDCMCCEATTIWGLSIRDCLKFQLKFDIIDLPQRQSPVKGSLEEAEEVLNIFNRF